MQTVSVVLVIGRFSTCLEAFEAAASNVTYAKYHFAGIFVNTVEEHNFHRQQLCFNLFVLIISSHLLKMI